MKPTMQAINDTMENTGDDCLETEIAKLWAIYEREVQGADWINAFDRYIAAVKALKS